jgi:hypothetical protein
LLSACADLILGFVSLIVDFLSVLGCLQTSLEHGCRSVRVQGALWQGLSKYQHPSSTLSVGNSGCTREVVFNLYSTYE